MLADLGVPGADWLLSFTAFAVVFTAFAIGGVANAINIIDGFHGLAGGTSLIALAAYGLMAHSAGDTELLTLVLLASALVAVFLVFNFPHGLLFLGDSGAYFLGVLLAAFAVALPARNPEVSPLVGLVVLGYPVMETLVSIVRRKLRKDRRISQADGQHLHSLAHDTLTTPFARFVGRPKLSNPLTATILWPLPLLCAILAVVGNQTHVTMPLAVGIIAWSYLRFYRLVKAPKLAKVMVPQQVPAQISVTSRKPEWPGRIPVR
jgi:UDP-N-acetylmuramyl pentapeptide phosphotransferase/UDP-N-acetylglucosamine-1-phosphate transferase